MTNQKFIAATILAFAAVFSFAIVRVDAATADSSISFKKDPISGLFALAIRDPDGVQEFSLSIPGELAYGGGLSGCPGSFSNSNVRFLDPDHFTPVMHAYVIDCKNNKTELEIPPPVKGVTRSSVVKKEVPPPPPPPKQEEQKEEKSEGPLAAADIRYPVPELGSCQNDAECRSYCDNADHAKECLAFAKKYHLISEENAKQAADKFLNVENGPGSCNSWSSCENYCNSVEHLDECIAFADKTGYYSPAELAEAKKFQGLVKAGKQFPGGCKDRNTCELYCSVADHMEECLAFAEESGFMPKEEIAEARKFMTLMRKGESPGGCTSKEQCEKYCFEENHTEECIAFAEKAGVMSAEDAAMARKVGGKGPGGCRGRDQCDTYCKDHGDECFRFAEEHGLINESDLKHMREGMARLRQDLDKMPPEALQCMKDAAGEENFNKMLAGEPVFDRSLESKMKSCFGKMTSQVGQQLNTLPPEAAQCIKDVVGEEGLAKLQSGEFDENVDFSKLEVCFQQMKASFGGSPGGADGSGGFAGPGGCKSIDECTAYCQDHSEECQNFAPPGGGGRMPGGGSGGGPGGGGARPPDGQGFGGPGGCTNQEECRAYCQEHPQECQNFAPPSGGGGSGGGFGGPGGNVQTDCSPKGTVASFVCAKNGKIAEPGVETTYFNECTAKGDGAEILHGGVCESHIPCADVADPVCGNDGHTWVSACYANQKGGGVKYVGACKSGGGNMDQPPPVSSCTPPPSGLVGWWSADLASGTTVPDIGGKRNGTISGGVTIVPMEVGNAFKFDGSSGRISMENPGHLNFGTGPFSLEAWFNWNGGGGTAANNIIRKSDYPVSGPGSGYWLRVGSGTLEFSVGATTGPDGQSLVTAPISTGAWHHAVAVRDDSGAVKLYVDGQAQGTVVRQASSANSTSETPFTIGAWDDRFGVTEFFNGQIDEIAVYNRALSASGARSLFEAGSIGKCAEGYGRTNRELPQEYQQQYQQQQSQPMENYSGPGGCKNPEECTAYCTAHYMDPACQQFMPPSSPSSSLPFSSLLGAVFGPLRELVK